MGILEHGIGQLLAQPPPAVELVGREEEEGDDEDCHQPHLDEEGQLELNGSMGTLEPAEMMMAVIP